jgi:hypothetical protein
MAGKEPKVIPPEEEPGSSAAAASQADIKIGLVEDMRSLPLLDCMPFGSSVPFPSSLRTSMDFIGSVDLGLTELEQLGIFQNANYTGKLAQDNQIIMMPSNVRTLKEWGTCLVCYGTIHKGKLFEKVYNGFPEYRRWIKSHAKGDEQQAFRQYVLARERIDARQTQKHQENQLPITAQRSARASTHSP